MKSLQHELLVAVLFAVSGPSLVSQQLASSPFSASVQGQPIHNESPDWTSACSYTFSSGSGNTFLKFCVTANGNVTQLETPAGQEFIAKGGFSEGYGLCGGGVAYFDYADWGDSGNWQAPKTLSQSATTVKIARMTNDGTWTLTQTFSLDSKTPAVKIVMALKNNSPADHHVYLHRYADIDVGAGPLPHDNFDSTTTSAWGYGWAPDLANRYGLMLKSVIDQADFVGAFARSTDEPPFQTCSMGGGEGPFLKTDGSVELAYFETISAGKTKTHTMVYRGM